MAKARLILEVLLYPTEYQIRIMADIFRELEKVDSLFEELDKQKMKISNMVVKCTKSYMGLNTTPVNVAHNHIRDLYRGGGKGLKIIINQSISFNSNTLSVPVIGDIKVHHDDSRDLDAIDDTTNIKRVSIIYNHNDNGMYIAKIEYEVGKTNPVVSRADIKKDSSDKLEVELKLSPKLTLELKSLLKNVRKVGDGPVEVPIAITIKLVEDGIELNGCIYQVNESKKD